MNSPVGFGTWRVCARASKMRFADGYVHASAYVLTLNFRCGYGGYDCYDGCAGAHAWACRRARQQAGHLQGTKTALPLLMYAALIAAPSSRMQNSTVFYLSLMHVT